MDEKERKALMKSLYRSSVAGTAIITFILAFVAFHYAEIDVVHSAMISALLALAITLARTRSGS